MDENSEFGLQITTKSRESILTSLEHSLRSSLIRVNSERTVNELLTFIINSNGKVEADDGYNDDLVMSLALTAYVIEDIKNGAPVLPTKNESIAPGDVTFEVPFKTSSGDLNNEDIKWLID